MKRWIAFATLVLVGTIAAAEDETPFSKLAKAKLVFREATAKDDDLYPHELNVYLYVENISDSELRWSNNLHQDITAELLDAAGKPVPHPPSAGSLLGGPIECRIPFGSRLEWLISHGGVSMAGDVENSYAIVVGGKGWLVPKDALANYSLRIKSQGYPWGEPNHGAEIRTLLEIPPTKIKLAQP